MPIHKIYPEDIEVFSLETNPSRTFVSSSTTGVTGVVHLYPRRSDVEKEVHPLSAFSASWFLDQDLNGILANARQDSLVSGSSQPDIQRYLDAVGSQSVSARKQQTQEIVRFTPGVDLDKDFLRKRAVMNTLIPYYRCIYPTSHWGYTNYHSLNFFTASSVPTASVLLYPHGVTVGNSNILTGSYFFSGAFSFDFWINPKYTTDGQGAQARFSAGTLLHLSSTYVVSLITGSSKDVNQRPDGYRVLLQLSKSADVSPSLIATGSLPEFVFLSSDNSLRRNQWHHVTVRWGASYNNGSGSFVVNGVTQGTFVVPSGTVTPTSASGKDNPTVLCVGNFYEGTNSGSSAMGRFFAADVATREGLTELDLASGVDQPASFSFRHPLNAEVHDVKIYSKYLNNNEIITLGSGGASVSSSLLFYLPPFFTRESPTRQFWNGSGGVLETPFFTEDGTTKQPFSVGMSFGVGGHYINLENFTRDFAQSTYPRLWQLSGSATTAPSIMPATANDLLYATASNRRRALTIMPCDNGAFVPNFGLLSSLDQTMFVGDVGTEPGSISLLDLYPTSSIFSGLLNDDAGTILNQLIGPDPSTSASLGTAPGDVPTILQRTRDNSSNQVCFFDISNLFYGNQIEPGTLTVWDTAMSGSDGKVGVTLKDDGNGNLYRADSTGSLATWNSVGNVFYNEGLVVVKSPHLYFFGENGWTMTFKGRQNLHVLHINCMARPLMETSSSNPSYIPVSASQAANNIDQKYVYITDVLIQDDNLNVIGRMKMAQPIVKKTSEKLLFKFSMDF